MSGGGSLNQDFNRDRSRSPMERKPALNKSRGKRPTKRIQVSNIPYEYKWQDLKDLFRQEVGEVSYVELYKDDSGRPRGAGVIEFANEETAQKAIEKMHRYSIGERSIIVKEDHETGNRPIGRGNSQGGNSGGGNYNSMHSRLTDMQSLSSMNTMSGMSNMGGMNNMGAMNNMSNMGNMSGMSNMSGMGNMSSMNNMQSGGGMQSQVNYGNTYGLSVQFLESLGINCPLVNRVFVANLDYNVDDEKLQEVFKMAGKVVNVDLSKDPDTKKSRGFGVIEFEHPVEAVQAISMLHGQWFFERKMSVRMDRVNNDSKKTEKPSATKLPAGLKGLGMGLGCNGGALTDVTSLPTNTTSVQSSSSNMGTGMYNMGQDSMMGMGGAFGQMGNNENSSAMGGMMGMGGQALMTAMAQQMGGGGGGGGRSMGGSGVNSRAFGGSRFNRN